MLVLCLSELWGLSRLLAGVGDVAVSELHKGYTTLPLRFGSYWMAGGRFRLSTDLRLSWDYSALWQLESANGAVVEAPSTAEDPPGMYPSPSRPGAYELWTGVLWTRQYQ